MDKNKNDIDEIYGEDVGDLRFLAEKCADESDGYYMEQYNEDWFVMYWGDQDVKNVWIILSNDVKHVRTFSNENGYKIEDLYILIGILSPEENKLNYLREKETIANIIDRKVKAYQDNISKEDKDEPEICHECGFIDCQCPPCKEDELMDKSGFIN